MSRSPSCHTTLTRRDRIKMNSKGVKIMWNQQYKERLNIENRVQKSTMKMYVRRIASASSLWRDQE